MFKPRNQAPVTCECGAKAIDQARLHRWWCPECHKTITKVQKGNLTVIRGIMTDVNLAHSVFPSHLQYCRHCQTPFQTPKLAHDLCPECFRTIVAPRLRRSPGT